MELNDIRLKESTELSEEERGFLKEHEGELTDAEKEDYKDILGKKEGEEGPVTFKTKEELNEYLDKHYEERKTKETEGEGEGETGGEEELGEGEIFPKDYKPKDWNEFAADFLDVIREEREVYTQRQRDLMAEIDRKMDQDTEDLRRIDPSIPATGTKERKEFDREIAGIMIKDPKSIKTVVQAYGVYKGIQSKKDASEEGREGIAAKVGGGSGAVSEAKPVKYGKYASRDLDAAEEAALKKFENLS